MSDPRDVLDGIVNVAEREMARLGRIEIVDVRDELRFHVWPTLVDICEAVNASLEDDELPSTVPVDLVARTVGLILNMANELGQHLSSAEMTALAARAADVTEELMQLCDPDELAGYVDRDGEHHPIIDGELVTPDREPGIIDTTAEPETKDAVSDADASSTENAES